ncbi:MAG: Gfo/Idh/MocA family oxidoreductase [Rhodocyclaceae bacterium]|nr:Gfo/Idh/MocA family oxidoreductase [Rhodocyclaceae bacterium]
MKNNRVGLIGAGRISRDHLEALKATPGVTVSAVVDPNRKAAEALAALVGNGTQVYTSLEEALAAKAFDRAHVLVPPNLHAPVGTQVLKAGVHCLMEKPISVTSDEAKQLLDIAAEKGVTLGAGQNYIFHPAMVRFKKELDAGCYGRVRFVSLVVAVPLAQLNTKQFGHWMFERPSNIILEQIVHPLSQIIHLIGRAEILSASAAPAKEIAPSVNFHKSFDVTLKGTRGNAQLHMAFGENFPIWQLTAVCDDGVVVVDGNKNSVSRHTRTRYLEAGDNALSQAALGKSLISQSIANISRYVGAQLKLAPRSDAFYQSLLGCVQDFHDAVSSGRAPLADGQFGADMVDLCMDIARQAGVSTDPVPNPAKLLAPDLPVPHYDVAVFGGMGFIGKHVVQQLLDAGYSVGVIGRSARGLPEFFNDPKVTIVRGDVSRREDIVRGIGSARYVVNLAHGGGASTRQGIVSLLAGSATTIGEVCLEKKVELLVFVSSIAGLYLGDASETILPSTPCDPQGERRGDYSYAKGEAERALLEMHKNKGLPVTIQRPGVVVGLGTSPFHSGVGLFNNEQHCLGWNQGNNPLPLVLVEDTASAIVAALKAGSAVNGRTDNIVGPVRLSAREYMDELKQLLGRPLKFHPQSVGFQMAIEWGKWAIKTVGGKKVQKPSSRDFMSRGMPAQFDTSETERILNWTPTQDRNAFIEKALVVPAHALLE